MISTTRDKKHHIRFVCAALSASIFFSSLGYAAAPPCEQLSGALRSWEDTVFQRTFQVFGPPAPLPLHQGKISILKLLGSSSEVVIGFDGGHAYFFADQVRVDGEIMSIITVKGRTDLLSSGYLLRFKDLSAPIMQKIRDAARASHNRFSATCADSVCKVLDSAGLRARDGSRFATIDPARLFEALLTKGIADSEGSPIAFELVRVNEERNLDQFVADMQRDTSDRKMTYVFAGFYGGAVMAVILLVGLARFF